MTVRASDGGTSLSRLAVTAIHGSRGQLCARRYRASQAGPSQIHSEFEIVSDSGYARLTLCHRRLQRCLLLANPHGPVLPGSLSQDFGCRGEMEDCAYRAEYAIPSCG